jgi:hypothetical protein
LGQGVSLPDIIGKINTLNPSRDSIAQGDALVKDYSIDEVLNWLKSASDQDIVKKPGFYTALVKRYKNVRRTF